jgi:rubrerythrin
MPRAPFDERPTGNGYGIGVSQSTVANWLSRTLKEEKERKREKAFALWMACHTQEEIAEAVEMERSAISKMEDEFVKKLEVDNFTNSADFTPPIYNVWKRQADRDDKKSRTR